MEATSKDYLKDIPVEQIYVDDRFNCRGQIPPHTVAELAADIKQNGLQNRINVQPAGDVKGDPLPEGKLYRVLAGHRRFTACSILGHKMIPCIVKPELDDIQARVLNLSENLQREQLNILQEARAIANLAAAGVPREHVAKLIKKSGSWVQARYALLRMPQQVQEAAAAGLIGSKHLMQLATLKNDEEIFAAVRKFKEAKERGETIGHIGNRKKASATAKKERKRDEMFDAINTVASAIGYCFATRCLAWTAGEISTLELFQDLKEEAKKLGKPEPMLPETL